MTEHRPNSPEHLPRPESTPEQSTEQLKQTVEHEQAQPEQHSIEQIQQAIEQHAVAAEEYQLSTSEPQSAAQSYGVQHELKEQAYYRTLKNIQQRLPAPARAFSKFTHQPAVDITSTVVANSVGRPLPLLAGSISALIGVAGLLYASKHYGFHYNYFVFVALFGAGFLLGLIFDLASWTLARRRH